VRIAPAISEALIKMISERLSPSFGSELFLFGSRADVSKKGGDIDLLLVTDEKVKNLFKALSTDIKSALREAAGDQRVDLSVINSEERKSDPFFSSLVGPILLLKKW
jgi:predicted nucleotidyltransferase